MKSFAISIFICSAILVFFPNSLLAQWERTNGPFSGGNAWSLAVSGTDVYASTDAGIFVSSNNGKRWIQRKNVGLKNSGTHSLLVSGTDLYAGSNDGIYLSADGGDNWRKASDDLNSRYIGCIMEFGGRLITGTYDGIFVSDDRGVHWKPASEGLSDKNVIRLAVCDGKCYAGTYYRGVYRLKEDGASWDSVNIGLNGRHVTAMTVAGQTLFAATDSGIARFNSAGGSWTMVNTGLPTINQIATISAIGSVVYADIFREGVFRSSDSGESWEKISADMAGEYVYSIVGNGSRLIAATTNGAFYSDDGGRAWTPSDDGFKICYIDALAASGGTLFAGTDGQGVFVSDDEGATWSAANHGMTKPNIYCLASDGQDLYAGSYSNAVFHSADNGLTWEELNIGYNDGNVLALIVSGSDLIAGGFQGDIFHSSDKGKSWTKGASATDANIKLFTAFGPYLFAGTTYGGILRSSDNGKTWSPSKTGGAIRAFAALGQTLYAATYPDGIIRSPDNGASWTAANTGLPANFSPWYIIACGENLVTADGNIGTYLSSDKGESWIPISNDLPNKYLGPVISFSDHLFAGSSSGVWRRPLSGFAPSVPPKPFLAARMLAIKPTPVRKSCIDSVLVVGSGADTLTNLKVVSTANEFYVSSSFPVWKGDSTYVKITFYPSVVGTASGMILFSSVIPAVQETLFVQGVGTGAVLRLPRKTLSFGNILQGTIKDSVAEIRNDGNDSLKISKIISTNAAFTSISSSLPPIPPGASFFDTIRATSPTIGSVKGKMIISSNALSRTDTIDVDGYYCGTPRIRSSADTVQFGQVELESFKDVAITLSNTGTDTLKILSILSPDSSVCSLLQKVSIPPGKSAVDTLRFSPAKTDTVRSFMLIRHNAITGADTIRIIGSGLPINWTRVTPNNLGAFANRVMINRNGDIFLGTSSKGIYRSTDKGVTWKMINHGLTAVSGLIDIIDLASSADGTLFAAEIGAFRSTDNGETWQTMNLPDVSWLHVDDGRGIVYAALNHTTTRNSTLCRSVDGGKSWNAFDLGIQDGYITSLWNDRAGTLIAGIYTHGIYRSGDQGQHWENASALGSIWSPCSFTETDNGVLLAAAQWDGIYRSRDGGLSWDVLTPGLGTLNIKFVMTAMDGSVLAATDANGLFRSTDHGDHWSPFNAGLRDNSILSMALDGKGYVYVLNSGGLFRSVVPIVTAVPAASVNIPTENSLNNNYPNPFNPSTTISFSLKQPAHASLTIYDIMGRTVERLLNQPMEAGRHMVTWNASTVPSGVYFYRLEAGAFTATKKMILMK